MKTELHQIDFWSNSDVRAYLEEEFNVQYCKRSVVNLLRGFGMYYYKPSPIDIHRPKNADNILKMRLNGLKQQLELDNVKFENCSFGFCDETSYQNYHNSSRLWSFFKKRKEVNSKRNRLSTFGFYAMKGNSVYCELENAKSDRFVDALKEVKNKATPES